ncbi:jerky protein homolog [Sorex araneus]|uniref:jerky protein homolog n=1 Tax=Sorex araneus TaxID=42254 RepID=UPI002433900E|nr:jerky protein homolog [Sorex araneus]XP_054981138.1 jerky protein homolog [Sorex araneus]XP_054981139.1 jerky protein homolog [Sorex araneus]XP_054981140.1 jerky protein homolog [Sorex araneus]XP_054981141.1 jerky protein homolog [Sorex araneus]
MASKPAAARGPGEKRKRVVLTLREKIDICTRLERGESRKALMQEYNVGMSTLYDIRAHKAQLLRFFASSDSNTALERRRTLHTPKLEHLDRVLYEWFLGRRAEGVPVSGPMLIEKARDLYEQMGLTEPCVFSGGWLWRFKARHGIRKLDTAGEQQGAEQQAAEFCGFFRSLAAEHSLSPEQVYNADETGLFWQCLPSATAAATAETMPGLGQSKDRLTVLTCANATGSHKIRPLVIGKCSGAPVLKGPQQLPVAYRAQGNVWVDQEVFSDWFHHIFVPSVKEHFSAVGFPAGSKAVLLLVSSRAHPQEAELASDNIFTILLPASVATLVQPMDQGIRRDFMRRFVSPAALAPGTRPRCALHEAILRVACAWDAVPRDVFSRAWKKLWPAAAVAKGSSFEEDAERSQVSQNQTFAHIMELVRDSPARAGRLPQSVAGGQVGLGQEAAERPPMPAGPAQAEGAGEEVAWARAAESFAVVVAFAEQHPCFSAQELGQLRALRSVFARQQLARGHLALRAVVKLEAPQECSPLSCSSVAGP